MNDLSKPFRDQGADLRGENQHSSIRETEPIQAAVCIPSNGGFRAVLKAPRSNGAAFLAGVAVGAIAALTAAAYAYGRANA